MLGRRGNLIMILQEERHQVWELQSNLWLPTLLLTLGTGKQLQQLHHHQLQSALPRNYQISYYIKSYKSWQNKKFLLRFRRVRAQCRPSPSERRRTASSRPSVAETSSSMWAGAGAEAAGRDTNLSLILRLRTVTTIPDTGGIPVSAFRRKIQFILGSLR